jgi:uncharacterized membrane protein
MNMTGVSLVGWLHTLVSTAAILIGGWMLIGPKGTALHRRMGRLYVYTMLAANLSAFGVYHFDIVHFVPFQGGPGIFGLFHWEAVFTLAFLLLGWFAAMRQSRAPWAYVHPLAMLVTYYMLIGGLVNELFVRVGFIRDTAMAQLHGAGNPVRAPIAGEVQGAVTIVFLILVVYFPIKVALYRRSLRATVPA